MATAELKYKKSVPVKGKVTVEFWAVDEPFVTYKIKGVSNNSLSIKLAIESLISRRKDAGVNYPGMPPPVEEESITSITAAV